MIEIQLKILGAVIASSGVLFTAIKMWQAYRKSVANELRNHNDKLIVHDSELAAQKEEIDEMKVNFQKSFEALNKGLAGVGEDVGKRIEKIEDKNREDHRLLFDSLNGIGNAVSDISGYLRAKNEKNI